MNGGYVLFKLTMKLREKGFLFVRVLPVGGKHIQVSQLERI